MNDVVEAIGALDSVLDDPMDRLRENEREVIGAARAVLMAVRKRLEQDFQARLLPEPIGTVLLMEIDQGNAVTEMDGRRRYWRSISDASEGYRLVGWLETTGVAADAWLHELLDARIDRPRYRLGRHNTVVPI